MSEDGKLPTNAEPERPLEASPWASAAPSASTSLPPSRSPSPSPEPAKGRHIAIVMNSAIALLLAGTTCVVLLSAAPSIFRAALPSSRAPLVARGASRLGGHAPPADARRSPRSFHDDPGDNADDRIEPDDFERLYPGAVPEQPSLSGEPEPDPASGSEPSPRASGEERPSSIRVGLVRRTLKLLEHPSDSAGVLGEIAAGEQVVVIKEAGLWALVFHSGSMGWARKSEIAVR